MEEPRSPFADLLLGNDDAVATAVLQCASASHTRRIELAQDAVVLARLVTILTDGPERIKDEPGLPKSPEGPEISWQPIATDRALAALVVLARSSPVCVAAVATALTRDAIAWLAEKDDKTLLPMLADADHDFALRLAQVRGVLYYSNLLMETEEVSKIRCGVRSLCLLAQCETYPHRQSAHSALVQIAYTHQCVLDVAAETLSDLPYADSVLLASPFPIADHIEALRTSRRTGTCRGRERCAALCVAARATEVDGGAVAQLVHDGGVQALIDAIEIEVRYHRQTEAKTWPMAAEHVIRIVLNAINCLAIREPLVFFEIKDSGGVPTLLKLACSDTTSASLAVQVLETFFLSDREMRAMVSVTGGLGFLVRHLRDGANDALRGLSVDVLENVFGTNTAERADLIQRFVALGGVTHTMKLYRHTDIASVRRKAESLLQSLHELMPILLAQLDEDALRALEVVARHRTNRHALVVQHRAVSTLANLVNHSSVKIQIAAIKVLQQLTLHEGGKRELLGRVGLLIDLVEHEDSDEFLVCAAVATLRHLATDDDSRTTIGYVIPRLITIVQLREAMELKVAAMQLLGELVRKRHRDNQRAVAACSGIAELVDVLQNDGMPWRLHHAAASVLYPIAKHEPTYQRELHVSGAVAVLEDLVHLHQDHPIEEADRLMRILQGVQGARC